MLLPVVAVLTGVGGYGVCLAAGWAPHVRELIAAGLVAIAASELSLIPLWLLRRGDQATVSQAGLGATVLHMMLTVAITALAIVTQPGLAQVPLVGWTVPIYLVMLAGLSAGIIMAIRSARRVGTAKDQGTSGN